MRLHAAFLVGAALCVPPIQAGEAAFASVRLAAAEPDCATNVHLGQAPGVQARAPARLEEYLQFHAEAVQSSERGTLWPWSNLRMQVD
ncbi:MAG TPA: hypothetical protein VFU53_10875 [Burkholderiales bacterium]|nr:hypothetical protein [Burkholderiales bacterium]